MDDLAMYLHEMGLSKYEASAYLALLSEGKGTAKAVAQAGDIPQSRVYDTLERLANKGFVTIQPGRPKKFGAVTPERAINQFGEYKERKFETEYENVMSVGEEFVESVESTRLGTNTPEDPDIIWSYHSDHQLFDVFAQLCREASQEVRMVTRADSIERKVGRLDEKLSELSREGVRLRVLLPQSQQVRDVVVNRLTEFAEVRQGTGLEGQIYVFDDADVLIAFTQNGEYVGLTIHNEALCETLIRMFEELWESCY